MPLLDLTMLPNSRSEILNFPTAALFVEILPDHVALPPLSKSDVIDLWSYIRSIVFTYIYTYISGSDFRSVALSGLRVSLQFTDPRCFLPRLLTRLFLFLLRGGSK